MKKLSLMLPLVLSISACGPAHFAALTKETHDSLTECKRPIEPPREWLSCADADAACRDASTLPLAQVCIEALQKDDVCRRALETPLIAENAQRHHRCATIVEQVKREADRVRDGG